MKISKYVLNIFGFTLIICSLFISASAQSLKERYLNPPFSSSINDSGFTSWQWLNPLPQGNALNSVFVFNDSSAIAIGYYGTIIMTNNRGLTWTVQNNINWGDLEDLSFPNNDTGFIAGNKGILRTTNGGFTWTQVNKTGYLEGIDFLDINRGIAVGSNGIYATKNAGRSWNKQFDGGGHAVAFGDSNIAIAVGDNGAVLRTTNRGMDWTDESLGIGLDLYDVSFINNKSAIVVGEQGIILRTTDSGMSFELVPSGTNFNLQSVHFIDQNIGVAVGLRYGLGDTCGIIIRTTDGGNTWGHNIKYFTDFLLGISLDDSIGFAVGWSGRILRTIDGGIQWENNSKGTTEHLNDISFFNKNIGIAVGSSGTLIRTTNGGMDWQDRLNFSNEWITSISIIDTKTAFTVGRSGKILKTTDGGESWINIVSGTTKPLLDVSFSSLKNGVITGEDGILLITTDGGITWQERSSGTYHYLQSVCFIDSLRGVIVGNGGTILRTTDAGLTWYSKISNTTKALYSVFFMNATRGIAVGGQGIILATTDGGESWEEKLNPIGNWCALFDVYFLNTMVGIAVGGCEVVLQTSDGGETWDYFYAPVKKGLNAVTCVQSGIGGVFYATGDDGAIICIALSPFNPKIWTWTGIYDSSWHNPNNWLPVGTPLPGDSVIIASAVYSPIIDSVQQQIVIASLNILSGGRLTITDALPRFVVLADVTVYGTLEIRPPASTTIIVGGNWTINPGGSNERFAYLSKINYNRLNDEGFIPYHSTVLFSGNGDMAGNFYNVMFDTASGMRSLGNIHVGNQCTMVGDVSMRRNDTVFVTASFPQALVGPGKFLRGTIKRNIEPSTLEPYNFESQSSFIKFDGSGTYPSSITITTFPDTTPSNFGDQWTVIPSRVDTATNTIVADSIKEFSKWVFGIPRPRVINDTSSIVQRVYEINAEGGSGYNGELSLSYDQTEVPIGLPEDSLQLIRLEGSVDVKENVQELPKEFSLGQNYPNPFNPSTTIRYELPKESFVTLKVYNLLGQEVSTLVNEKREAGRYEIAFDGSKLTSGVYFYRFVAGSFIETKKLVIIK